MSKGRMFNTAAAVVAVLLAVGLYKAKTDAEAARARVAALEAEVSAARQEIKVLAAEVAYLESPERVEALARKKLGLKPAALDQHRPLSDIDKALPAPAEPPAP